MLSRLRDVGFAGIWLDRNGYSDNGAQMVKDLARYVPEAPITSEDGRYAFYSLRSLLQPGISQSSLLEALNPVSLEWSDGFYVQEGDPRRYWRWSRRSSSLTFVNPLPVP